MKRISHTSLRSAVFFVLLSCWCITHAAAQDVSFSASVDRTKVGLGEQFQISYTISGGNPNAIRGFRAADMNKDFIVLGGPNQSTSLQIINGNYSSTITYSYILQPRKMGKFSIPGASITVGGQEKTSNSVSIEVTLGSQKPQQPQEPKNAQEQADDAGMRENLFLRATLDKNEVYIGEPVTVSYKVYTRVSVQNFTLKKQPRTVGFWSEEFPISGQLDGSIETLNGKQYKAYVIRKVALFPTQAGNLEIDPLEISCIARVRQRRKSNGESWMDKFFDDPFFDSYTSVEKELSSQTMKVHVKPLPLADQPMSFRGAVGDFTMSASLDNRTPKTNETATLKVKVEGSGNIKLLEPPQVNFPTDIDHYDPKTNESITKNGGVLSGVKTFEYLMIPRYPGERTIPAVEFSYFDLSSKKYVTLKSEAFILNIGKGKTDGSTALIDAHHAEFMNQDVRPLKAGSDDWRRIEDAQLPWSSVLLFYLLPLGIATGLILYKRKYNREHADVVGYKMKRAHSVAEKRLSLSKKLLRENKIDEYYLEIARALWGFIQDRLAIPTSEASHAVIEERLLSRNIPLDVIEQCKRAIDLTEYARFSPTRASEQEMNALYDHAMNAIVQIEQRLKV